MNARVLSAWVLLAAAVVLVSCTSTSYSLKETQHAENVARRHLNTTKLGLEGPLELWRYRSELRASMALRVHPRERERLESLMQTRSVGFFVTEPDLRPGGGSLGVESGFAGGDPPPIRRRLLLIEGDSVIGDFTLYR